MEEQDKRVVSQFTAQSKNFGSGKYIVSSQEYLKWAVERMPLNNNDRVLDVAAGTGLFSFAVSPYAGQIVAVDLTPAMIHEGRKNAAEKGIMNVLFKQGNAYDLHEERGYDMAISRLAFHHMSKPRDVLNEMAKAVRHGGSVVVVDLVSPDDERAAENYNLYEKLRDDSHTRALTKEELISICKAEGLTEITLYETDVINDLEQWMDMTGTAPQNGNIIKKAIREDLSGGERTGLFPFIGEEGNIKFFQHWAMVIGKVL